MFEPEDIPDDHLDDLLDLEYEAEMDLMRELEEEAAIQSQVTKVFTFLLIQDYRNDSSPSNLREVFSVLRDRIIMVLRALTSMSKNTSVKKSRLRIRLKMIAQKMCKNKI